MGPALQEKTIVMGLPQWQQGFLQQHGLPQTYLSYAQQWFAPLAESLAVHQNGAGRAILVAVNGSQGSGKTTACDYLRAELEENHALRVVSLSLDDFYLTRAQRESLAVTVHPLLATRGVPGTHDMNLLQATLTTLLASDAASVEVPRFDKARDDRRPQSDWDVISDGVDVVLLEGWCLGARAQTAEQLAQPVNALEAQEDPQGTWRQYVNEALDRDFQPLYKLVDQWVMLAAPSFDCVYRWRLEQEQKLAQHSQGDAIMSAAQVARFIQFYQRLTQHCLQQLPSQVRYLYQLDEQRQVVSHQYIASTRR